MRAPHSPRPCVTCLRGEGFSHALLFYFSVVSPLMLAWECGRRAYGCTSRFFLLRVLKRQYSARTVRPVFVPLRMDPWCRPLCEQEAEGGGSSSDDEDEEARPRGVPWPNGRPPLLDAPARPASDGEKRALKRARVARIDMPAAARSGFSEMRPDFAMLEEHESKVQRLAGRLDGEVAVPIDKDVHSVMSSTAGAGSQDFHEYRRGRRHERGRLGAAHADAMKAKAKEQWEVEQAERAAEQP